MAFSAAGSAVGTASGSAAGVRVWNTLVTSAVAFGGVLSGWLHGGDGQGGFADARAAGSAVGKDTVGLADLTAADVAGVAAGVTVGHQQLARPTAVCWEMGSAMTMAGCRLWTHGRGEQKLQAQGRTAGHAAAGLADATAAGSAAGVVAGLAMGNAAVGSAETTAAGSAAVSAMATVAGLAEGRLRRRNGCQRARRKSVCN